MMDDAYELVPHDKIEEMKKEIEELKKELKKKNRVKNESPEIKNAVIEISNSIKKLKNVKSNGGSFANEGLKESVDSLNDSVRQMVELFSVAKEISKEEKNRERKSPPELRLLVEQNRAIAQGILAVTEILRDNIPLITNLLKENPKYKILRIRRGARAITPESLGGQQDLSSEQADPGYMFSQQELNPQEEGNYFSEEDEQNYQQ